MQCDSRNALVRCGITEVKQQMKGDTSALRYPHFPSPHLSLTSASSYGYVNRFSETFVGDCDP
ncbi:hypothetical protein E2C01_101281 [Portunus trituberculatus]|uniref:Uncharacterized protein n=1 Tax=Portunus trituberculatus TaxID=210409 RepID=A0A5B7KA97_PORTR|nr:hypothetical protein [Portunus trituberculatus]